MSSPLVSGAGGYEILLHNVSHSDLVIAVNDILHKCKANDVIARPKFSHFKKLCEHVYFAQQNMQNDVVTMPTCRRVRMGDQYKLVSDADNLSRDMDQAHLNISAGLRFCDEKCTSGGIAMRDTSLFRFRKDDGEKLRRAQAAEATPSDGDCGVSPMASTSASTASASIDSLPTPFPSACVIDSVYFPLVAILLPKWISSIPAATATSPAPNKVLVLITGAGTPADTKAKFIDNSTEFTGKIIQQFVERVFPSVTVLHLHSALNIFRYDENIEFVKIFLNPLLELYRARAAREYGGEWKNHFNVTLSFADGSSARTSAINAAIRLYKPSYMHFWQLKTFWHETKLCEDDIESHSYAEIATIPAVMPDHTSPDVQLVVKEMERFKAEFYELRKDLSSDRQDLTSFWLRKTKKPVLAVLMVLKPNPKFHPSADAAATDIGGDVDEVDDEGEPKYLRRLYRGSNMEVSMPTGSLCAERNVIGSALAADLTLKRVDLRYIAVYSASLEPIPAAQPLTQRDSSAGDAQLANAPSLQIVPPPPPGLPLRGHSGSNLSSDGGSDCEEGGWSPTPSNRGSSTGSTGSVAGEGLADAIPTQAALGAAVGSHRSQSQGSDVSTPTTSSRRQSRQISSSKFGMLSGGASGSVPGSSGGSPVSHRDTPPAVQQSQQQKQPPPPLPPLPSARGNRERERSQDAFKSPVRSQSSDQLAENRGSRSGGKSVQRIFAKPNSGSGSRSMINLAAAAEAGGSGSAVVGGSVGIAGPRSLSPPPLPGSASKGARGGSVLSSSASDLNLAAQDATEATGTGGEDGYDSADGGAMERLSGGIGALLCMPATRSSCNCGYCVTAQQGGTPAPTTDLDQGPNADSEAAGSGTDEVQAGASSTVTSKVFFVGENDMNPLKPCGACNEWLKKIAEVNPSFSVITFTDENCHGVYVEEIDTV